MQKLSETVLSSSSARMHCCLFSKVPLLACILSVIAAVAVAIPLMRCMKFNAIRSATRIERALPFTTPNLVPDLTWSPSFPDQDTDKQGSTVEKTCKTRSFHDSLPGHKLGLYVPLSSCYHCWCYTRAGRTHNMLQPSL